MTTKKKRILIANPTKDIIGPILANKHAELYEIHTAHSGSDCWEKLSSFRPDLVVMDLMLPEMHALEILKKIKSDPKRKKIGVIITSAHAMIQNYHAAVVEGADYFFIKPIHPDIFFLIVRRFFAGKLHPDPFNPKRSARHGKTYMPKMHRPDSYIKFWGTRGSNPVSGAEFIRYGGNTSCLEVRHKKDLIIIDAGTGIRPLGEELVASKHKNIHLFIGHTHWDHITGFPFFDPIYKSDTNITLWGPTGFEKNSKEIFTEMLAYTFFPVRLDDIKAKITFREMHTGTPVKIGDIHVETHYACHPGETFCFKIRAGGVTFGYATDNELLMGYHGNPQAIHKDSPLLVPHVSLIKFFKDTDFLIHEAQYTPLEYQERVGWGHSSVSNATVLIKHCGSKSWIVTHHEPKHSDEELQRIFQLHEDILSENHLNVHFQMAYDGLVIPL